MKKSLILSLVTIIIVSLTACRSSYVNYQLNEDTGEVEASDAGGYSSTQEYVYLMSSIEDLKTKKVTEKTRRQFTEKVLSSYLAMHKAISDSVSKAATPEEAMEWLNNLNIINSQMRDLVEIGYGGGALSQIGSGALTIILKNNSGRDIIIKPKSLGSTQNYSIILRKNEEKRIAGYEGVYDIRYTFANSKNYSTQRSLRNVPIDRHDRTINFTSDN